MTNGITIGLAALAGVWLGWYALPICVSIILIIQLVEHHLQYGLIILCILVVVAGALRSQQPPSETSTPNLSISTGAIGTVESFPIPSGDGHRALLSVSELCVAEQCITAETKVLVYIPTQNPPLSKGTNLRVNWNLDTLEDLPLGYRSFVSSQGAEGSARTTGVQVITPGHPVWQFLATANQGMSTRMETLLPGDPGALGTGIVTGDDSSLSPETEANFKATGTSHITAVSGQNVTLIIGFLSIWFRPKTRHTRLAFHLLLFVAVWTFTLFVGMEAPALRAAIVATLSILGSHAGRRPDPVTLLALTLGAIALLQPLSVHAVGFWLSAAASMALCLTLPKTRSKGTKQFLAEFAAAPMIASLATMPIVLVTFGVWSPVGIITNMLISIVMTFAFPITYFFAILAWIAPQVAESLSSVFAIPLDFALVIVNRMAPVAMQLRIDSYSPLLLISLWIPIAITIWLVSNESQRWIRRILTNRRKSLERTEM